MSDIVDSVKQKDIEAYKKATIYTSVAYMLVEVADFFILDVDRILNRVGASVDKKEKSRFKDAVRFGKFFKDKIDATSKRLYELENSDAIDMTDELNETIKVIVDRCGGDIEVLEKIKNTIHNRFKSRYGYVQ